jgi:Zn-finger nucleic acid-binding protein
MDDPYRTSQQSGTCPRCQNPTESDGELDRLACVRGCGEWYPKAMFADGVDWQVFEAKGAVAGDAWPWGAALCPVCAAAMAVGYKDELRFDYCPQHGVWLDAGELERFRQVFRVSWYRRPR